MRTDPTVVRRLALRRVVDAFAPGVGEGEIVRFLAGADHVSRLIAQDISRLQTSNPKDGPMPEPQKPQVTEAELKTMTPEQIVEAQSEGRLDILLGRRA